MKEICLELSYENMMTQDISSVIDRRNPIFFDMNTYRLNQSVIREFTNHTSFDYQDCPVCGFFYARPFFRFCSSYCSSAATSGGYYLSKAVYLAYDDRSDLDELDWIVWEEKRIVKKIRLFTRAKRISGSERASKLKRLNIELFNLSLIRNEAVSIPVVH